MPKLRPKRQLTLRSLLLLFILLGASFSINEAFSQNGDASDTEADARSNFQGFGNGLTQKEVQEALKKLKTQTGTTGMDASKADPKDLQKMLKDFERDQGKITDLLEKANKDGQSLPGGINPAELLKMIESQKGKDGKPAKGLTPEQQGSMLKMVNLSLAQFRSMSHEDVETFILMRVKDKKLAHKFLSNSPRLMKFLVSELRHESALTDMFSIVFIKPRFYYYVGCMLFTMILGWIIKWRLNKKGAATFGQGFRQVVGRLFFIQSLRLGITIFFFHKELGPTWNIFKDSFLA